MPAPTFGLFPTEVARDPSLSFLAKAVYATLCTYRNVDTGICWPKRETLAGDMGCSIRSVSYALAELGEAGLISRTGDGGCNRSAETLMPWPGVEINPATYCTPPLQTVAGASNKPMEQKNLPQTPPFPANPQGEGDSVFQNLESETPINPEPLPVYQVEEQEIEHFTLDTLPAEIKALEMVEQVKTINPLVLLPILVALIGIAPELAQALLDELSGRMACQTLKAIDSPISYFRFLLKEAKAGRFTPRYGAEIAAARRANLAHQARLNAPPPPAPPTQIDRPARPKMSPEEFKAMLMGRPS